MIQSIKKSFQVKVLSVFFAVGMILGIRNVEAVEKVDEAAKKPEPATMPEVVVSGKADNRKKSYKPEKMSSLKYTEPLRDVPQTVTVIPEGVIQDQGATSLRDVLKNVPGISMQAGEGGGGPGGDFLSIRGFGARNDIYVDGVRDFGGYTRDPFNLEQVEVAKGPSSAYTGRGSTGGTVNLSSKTPKLDPFYRASVGFGTAEYKRVSMDINQPLKIKDKGMDDAAFRFNALFHDADVAGHEVIGDQRWGIAPSLALGIDTDTRLTLSYFQLNQDNMPTYGSPWVPAGQNAGLQAYRDRPSPASWNNFYGLTNRDREKTMTNIATVLFEHDFNEHVTLRNNFRWGRTHRDSILTAPRFQNVNTTNLNRQFQARDQVDKILANQTDLLLNFATGWIEHAVVTGIEAIREKSTNRPRTASVVSTTNLWNPDPGDAYAGQIRYGLGENAATSKSMALYGFDTMKLGDHFELNGGLRWDYFKTDYTPTTGQNFESLDSALTWRAGFVYKPVEIGSFYIGYGTSINPSSEGLVSLSPLSATTVSLDPEKSRTFEIGTKWDVLKERLSLSSAVFRTDKTNARTPSLVPGEPNILDGEQRVEGIEFGATGSITDEWNVFAGYTIMRSKIRETNTAADVGKKMSHVPEHSFNIWTTYKLPFNFEIGTGINFMDMRYANTSNTRKAPAYMLWDAMLAYTINEHYKLRLNAYNLTDQEYIDRIGGGHFISGPGRSATLTMDIEF
ncbi:MAG TPA: TonB-dependent siderophore receptor [Candidatus Omnitrophica bacterium]|nr:TonB-dependent siderophore receptor [Candidatus Omnitrophota bacterium]